MTRDVIRPDGSYGFGGIGVGLMQNAPGVEMVFLDKHPSAFTPEDLAGFDALAMLGGRITPESLVGNERLALIARFGVGYDNVDIPAATEAGVFVTITPEAVRRPMAVVNLTYMLELASNLHAMNRLTKEGRWGDRQDARGLGLTGRTLGTIGFGRIAQETHRLAKPLGMRHLAFDPYANPDAAAELGVELVDLDTVVRESDFLTVAAAYTPETRHIVNAERLAMMKPTAYLISTARGGLVDQAALYEAVKNGVIAGAGLDVFEQEPVNPNDPILTLDNVIVSPHALCWTDECERIMGEKVLAAVQAVANGEIPETLVNPEVANDPRSQARLAALKARKGA